MCILTSNEFLFQVSFLNLNLEVEKQIIVFFFFKDFLNTFHMAEKFKFLQVTYLIVYVYISPDISKLRSLEILDLTDNNLSNNIISSLSGLPRLKSLDLSFNNLKGSLDISGEYFYLNYISSSSLA